MVTLFSCHPLQVPKSMSALGVLEPTMELALKNNSFAKFLNNVGNVTTGTVKFQDKLVGLILKLIYQLSP